MNIEESKNTICTQENYLSVDIKFINSQGNNLMIMYNDVND